MWKHLVLGVLWGGGRENGDLGEERQHTTDPRRRVGEGVREVGHALGAGG